MCEVVKFKKAFFDLPSRAFGETYIQKILYKILGETKNKKRVFDAERTEDGRTLNGEYKAVRVVFEKEAGDTIYDQIMNFKPMSTRIGSIADIKAGTIVSNFQNIKLEENGVFDFDYLVYVLVDDCGFHIFEVSGKDMEKYVKNKKFKGWSDKHGSKETGKNGQFTIRSESLEFHKKFLKKIVSWQEILELSKEIKLKKKKS